VARTYAMEEYHAYITQLSLVSHKLTVMTELMRRTLDSFHGISPSTVHLLSTTPWCFFKSNHRPTLSSVVALSVHVLPPCDTPFVVVVVVDNRWL
jgi:hypothetical protein